MTLNFPLTEMLWSLEVEISIFEISPATKPFDVYLGFRRFGNVTRVIIGELGGRRGSVTLSGPFRNELDHLYPGSRLHLEGATESFECFIGRMKDLPPSSVSPLDESTAVVPSRVTAKVASLQFGTQLRPNEFHFIQDAFITPNKRSDVLLIVNFQWREIMLQFPLEETVPHDFRIVLQFADLSDLWATHIDSTEALLTFRTSLPPMLLRARSAEDPETDERRISEPQLWRRATTESLSANGKAFRPLALCSIDGSIDIGRWTAYRVHLKDEHLWKTIDQLAAWLQHYNIRLGPARNLEMSSGPRSDFHDSQAAVAGSSMGGPLLESLGRLSFPVRYQLEVCISKRYVSEHLLSGRSLQYLIDLGELEAISRLELIAVKKIQVGDLCNLPAAPKSRTLVAASPELFLSRTAVITPTTMYFETPTMDISNRVLRSHASFPDRFIRVRFADEGRREKLLGCPDDRNDMVYDRVYRCLRDGLIIGGRKYEFLASGNSQFREHGAFFFCPLEGLSTATLRMTLGDFTDNQGVAKYASRIGQCFTTTRLASKINPTVVEIEDVIQGSFIFTDGVGKLSPDLAPLTAISGGSTRTRSVPSVFQFRMGGFKGVVTIDPSLGGGQIHLRPSQYKFHAIETGLEIIRGASFITAQLNRQLITCLHSLGVQDQIFMNMLQTQLKDINMAMIDKEAALLALNKRIDPNHMTLTLAEIIRGGFFQDCFVKSALQLWRSWYMKTLKEKAAIVVEDAAFLLGCTDETNSLRGWYNPPINSARLSLEQRLRMLPEIFVQVEHPVNNRTAIIEGICIVARNPSLHPGDIRVVMAVNNPKLRHLKNVVVFPQNGDRDIPSMCSGGDLDGDDYFVCWDRHLIPTSSYWFESPMTNIEGGQPDLVDPRNIEDQIARFFIKHIKYDTLGLTATQWLANADWANLNIRTAKCQRLAQLHSLAVDFPKSGSPATVDKSLRMHSMPHFMARPGKTRGRIYKSRTILGRLFDAVQGGEYKTVYDHTFDSGQLLYDYSPNQLYQQAAREIKARYDAVLSGIMAQYDINTELEVWTTFVMQHSRPSRDYTFHEEIGRASSELKERFRAECYKFVGSTKLQHIAPFIADMYRVTHDQIANNIPEVEDGELCEQPVPFVSFPWIFHRELCLMVTSDRRHAKEDPGESLLDISSDLKNVEEGVSQTSYAQDLQSIDLGPDSNADHVDEDASQDKSQANGRSSRVANQSDLINDDGEQRVMVGAEEFLRVMSSSSSIQSAIESECDSELRLEHSEVEDKPTPYDRLQRLLENDHANP